MANPQPNSPAADGDTDFRSAVRRGIEDADAGRTISYDKIRAWLKSWGTPDELQP